MKNILLFLLFIITASSCNRNEKVEYIRLPEGLTTLAGQNIDSLIKKNQYTALIFYCDNCGASIGIFACWREIIKSNPKISPIIIAKADNEKLIETLFDINEINYPLVFYETEKIREENPGLRFGDVLLIDNSYKILNKRNPVNKKTTAFIYKNAYN